MKIITNVTGNLGVLPNGIYLSAYNATTCNGPFTLVACKSPVTNDSIQYFQNTGDISYIPAVVRVLRRCGGPLRRILVPVRVSGSIEARPRRAHPRKNPLKRAVSGVLVRPIAIRTHDLQSRSLTLYPTELRARKLGGFHCTVSGVGCQGFRGGGIAPRPRLS